MKVDNNADPRDFLFPMTEKKNKTPTSPSVFIILPVCAPSSEKTPQKTVFLADAALIPDSDTCKV